MIDLESRINAFSALGQRIEELLHSRTAVPFIDARRQNPWFTEDNIERALLAVSRQFLNEKNLRQWVGKYGSSIQQIKKVVGIICAGNLPLVSFHDILSVLISGHYAQIKLSSKDSVLTLWILQELSAIETRFAKQYSIVERLKYYDAVIATGSNNSARYFEYYFKDVPHIIRKNRTAVAILDGNETKEQLINLGHDVFDYFGLGCRNVSKLYLPTGYPLEEFKNHWDDFKEIMNHNSYRNNLDYQRTVFLMTSVPMVDIDFVNMIEKKDEIHAPLATLFFEFYDDLAKVESFLSDQQEQLQCICTNASISNSIALGNAQSPGLFDYADGIDVMAFLGET